MDIHTIKQINLNDITPKIHGASQKSQDNYIDHIFDCIGVSNKYYIEFGAADGFIHSNTHYLRTEKKWSGLLLEGDTQRYPENPDINLHHAFATMGSICDIFASHNVPEQFDFLSLDIDGNDYWILSKILEKYSPRVVMVETCVRFDPDVSKVQKYDPEFVWKGDRWVGGSPLAFKKLGRRFGYTAVHVHLDDMFLIKDTELHPDNLNPDWSDVYPKALPDLYLSHGVPNIVEDQWMEI